MSNAKRKELFRYGTIALALGVVATVLIGCSTNAPVAPAVDQPNGLNAIAFVEGQLGADVLSAVPDSGAIQNGLAKGEGIVVGYLASDTDSIQVGPDGGEVNLCLDSETSRLLIPQDALDGDVWISAKAALFGTPYGLVRMYEFQPEGLQFATQAKLYLSTKLPLGAVINLFYFNPLTGTWQFEQSASVDMNGTALFHLNHFSKYAIT